MAVMTKKQLRESGYINDISGVSSGHCAVCYLYTHCSYCILYPLGISCCNGLTADFGNTFNYGTIKDYKEDADKVVEFIEGKLQEVEKNETNISKNR